MSKGRIYKREVRINAISDNSAYKIINAKFIEPKPQKIGVSISAVRAIMQNIELTEKIMPSIIGLSFRDNQWHTVHKAYWNSIAVKVPTSGLKLDTSLVFDTDKDKEEFENKLDSIIREYAAKVKSAPKEEVFFYKERETKAIELEDSYLDKFKPTNNKDYILWRYTINYRDVANRQADRKASSNIRFYVHDKLEQQRLQKRAFELKTKAQALYADKSANVKWVDAMYTVLTRNDSTINTGTMSILDKQMGLYKMIELRPADVLELNKDSNLVLKAMIEGYINAGLLNRKPNSTLIVKSDNNDIIGNNMDEVISYFKNVEVNKVNIAMLAEKYKSLPKE